MMHESIAVNRHFAAVILATAGLLVLVGGCTASEGVTRNGEIDASIMDMSVSAPVLGGSAFAGASHLLRDAVAAGAFPGAVVVAGWRDSIIYADAAGKYGVDDPVFVDTSSVYDLASLTKVVAMTTSVMLLVAEGRIDLDAPAASYLPEFQAGAHAGVTIRQLLTHTSGLPAFRRLYLETETREAALDSIFATPLLHAPGSTFVYSDIGAIILGLIVERVSGEPLDEFAERRIFAPLAMKSTRYRPPPEWRYRIALTEVDPRRGGALRGIVHDENADHLGRVAGHAGLFSSAPDLARYASWMLEAYHGRIDSTDAMYVRSDLVREFVRRQPGPDGSTRALGWDTPSDSASTAGVMMSRQSFGHTGFTGTSIWIDPTDDFFVILLSNRVNPTRNNQLIRKVRGPLADSIFAARKAALTQ